MIRRRQKLEQGRVSFVAYSWVMSTREWPGPSQEVALPAIDANVA
jgi:hypothetical protein